MADVNAAFMQQIIHIPERQRKPDVHHHRQADDLGARLEVTKGETFCHRERQAIALPASTDFALTVPLGHHRAYRHGQKLTRTSAQNIRQRIR